MISTLCYSFTIPVFFFLILIFNTVGMSLPQASQPDELTIDEQEMLEVIEDGDMEDWVKVHKYLRWCAWALYVLPVHLLCTALCVFFHLSCMFSCCLCDYTLCVCVFFLYSRLAIRQDMWVMSQKNTCSSRPPTVCLACSSLWPHSTLDHTPLLIQPSRSCTPTASMEK